MSDWRRLLLAGLALACSNPPDDERAWSLNEQRRLVSARDVIAPTRAQDFAVYAPLGLQRDRLALSSAGTLQIGTGAEVVAVSGSDALGVVSALGRVDVEARAHVGALYGLGSELVLEPFVRVAGYVKTFGASRGTEMTQPRAEELRVESDLVEQLSWSVQFLPSTAHATGSPQGRAVPPGRYASLSVGADESATLSAGSYHFERLEIARGGQLRLHNVGDPLYIWVRDRLILRGALREATVLGNVLWGYGGVESPALETELRGTLVAPRARIVVRKTLRPHSGAFFARDILVERGALLEQRPFVINQSPPAELAEVCLQCGELATRTRRSCCSEGVERRAFARAQASACLAECEQQAGSRSSGCRDGCNDLAAPASAVALSSSCERDVLSRYTACLMGYAFRPASCGAGGETVLKLTNCSVEE